MQGIASVGAGLAASPVLAGCGGDGGGGQTEAEGPVDGGNVADLELDSPHELAQPVVVIRDADGVYAMTTICTHQQCDISQSGSISTAALSCGCHGSQFDIDGNVTSGPARLPLDHFAVTIDDQGNITVQAGEVVAPDTRAAVPAA
jgi:Rieske Fe-S protein